MSDVTSVKSGRLGLPCHQKSPVAAGFLWVSPPRTKLQAPTKLNIRIDLGFLQVFVKLYISLRYRRQLNDNQLDALPLAQNEFVRETQLSESRHGKDIKTCNAFMHVSISSEQ